MGGRGPRIPGPGSGSSWVAIEARRPGYRPTRRPPRGEWAVERPTDGVRPSGLRRPVEWGNNQVTSGRIRWRNSSQATRQPEVHARNTHRVRFGGGTGRIERPCRRGSGGRPNDESWFRTHIPPMSLSADAIRGQRVYETEGDAACFHTGQLLYIASPSKPDALKGR